MASVVRIAPDSRELHELRPPPAAIRNRKIWHLFDLEAQPGGAKPAKIPYRLDGRRRSGSQGTSYDMGGLGTWDEAREAAIRLGKRGVALALLPGCGIVVYDADHVHGPDGALPADLEALVCQTFSEVSVGGEGVHLYFFGNVGEHRLNLDSGPYRLDVFSEKGWIAYTGRPASILDVVGPINTITVLDDETAQIALSRVGSRQQQSDANDFMAGHEPRLGLEMDRMRDLVFALDSGFGRAPWITTGEALHHETDGSEEGFQLWHEWSEGAHNYSGEESMRYQWDRMRGDGSGRRRVTMASVIKMVNDLREAERKPVTAEDLAPAQEPYEGKFKPVRASAMSSAAPQWLIKGVLPRTLDPVVIFGASGSGKSFLAIALAGAIARGAAWRGHKSAKGRVLYVAAEGAGGVRKRIDAYCKHHGIDIADLDIDVLSDVPNVLDKDHIKEIVRMHEAYGPYDVTFVDTLAQVTPGANENAGEDMGLALANVKAVQRATRTTAVLVHHAGKDLSRGSRGWSGIKAAAEAQIEVSRDEDTGERTIRIEKMKDGEDGKRYGFALQTMTLSMDEDGDEVSSCVLVEAEVSERSAAPARTASRWIKSRDAWATHLVEVATGLETTEDSVSVQELLAAALEAMPEPESGRDTRRQNLMRALEGLSREKDGPMAIVGNRVVMYV